MLQHYDIITIDGDGIGPEVCQATVAVRINDGRMTWQTPLARRLMESWFSPRDEQAPRRLLDWIADTSSRH